MDRPTVRPATFALIASALCLPGSAWAQATETHADTGDTAWMLISAALVLLMTPGLALFYGGMVRRKNVLATLMYSHFALSLVTINPAKQLGIDKRVGSIESGKDADLVIYDKHPLSNYAKVQKVLIDGEVYFDRDNDVSQREAREAKRKMLIDRQNEQKKSAEGRKGR